MRLFVYILLLVWSCPWESAAGLITADNQTLVIGSSPTFRFAFRIVVADGEQLSTVQLEALFPAQTLSVVSVECGLVGTQSGKQVRYYVPAPGMLRVVVFGINQLALRSGELVGVVFQLNDQAQPGIIPIQLSASVASSPNASFRVTTRQAGSITLQLVPLAQNLAETKIYPNPWRRDLGVNQVSFQPLTEGAMIRIYSGNGVLIKEIKSLQGNKMEWDLRNNAGLDVVSGVYLYTITNSRGEKRTGKLALIK